MVQLSLRIDEELHREATMAARASGASLNGFIARVLRAAIDPASDEPDVVRIRARLAAAGLIDSPTPPPAAVYTAEEEARFQEAVARTAGGTPGSALIEAERSEGW